MYLYRVEQRVSIMDGLLLALAIFVLRIINNAMGTIRIVLIARQRMVFASMLAFVESLIFAFTVANVVNDLSNPLTLTAYCGGFAVGSYVGMLLERRFIRSFNSINVVTSNGGHELAAFLRDADFGVTETVGDGRDGRVSMLRLIVDRRDTLRALDMIREQNPEAFVAIEEARTIRQGYIRHPNGRNR